MSQENVEVVRTMWEPFLRRDFDTALSLRHAEIYTVRPGSIVRRQGFSDTRAALEAVGLSQ